MPYRRSRRYERSEYRRPPVSREERSWWQGSAARAIDKVFDTLVLPGLTAIAPAIPYGIGYAATALGGAANAWFHSEGGSSDGSRFEHSDLDDAITFDDD